MRPSQRATDIGIGSPETGKFATAFVVSAPQSCRRSSVCATRSSLLAPIRARDLNIRVGDLEPGEHDAITDVAGVRVGHTTLIEGDAVRTGVTVVVPPETPLFAGSHRLNGNGELTGLEWIRESGMLTTPIGLTNTFSVGVVRDAIAAASADDDAWALPVVGETYDGYLNDARGQHVTAEHAHGALVAARDGSVAEGNVGGGTGMICHGFKGGIGTASRVVDGMAVGVLVQANHGRRARFRVNGVPVGERVGDRIPTPTYPEGAGSIIGIVATDAPLLPHQCERLAQRAGLGVARMGGLGENSSGDLFLALATGNRGLAETSETVPLQMLPNQRIDGLFAAVVDATEEAILNALLAAKTMSGREGATAHALDARILLDALS
jgi:D-aminopeptidase